MPFHGYPLGRYSVQDVLGVFDVERVQALGMVVPWH
jgi:hypothetical protein